MTIGPDQPAAADVRTSIEVALDAAARCEQMAGPDATRAQADTALAYAAGVLRMLAAQHADKTVTYRRGGDPLGKCLALIGTTGLRCTRRMNHGGDHDDSGYLETRG